jgi:hypoxanthine phosphoribosyltransferase
MRIAFNRLADPPMRVLLSADEIQSSIRVLAEEINRREAKKPLTVIAVMTGSVIFLADLIRQLDMPLRVGVIQARSYAGTDRGELSMNSDMLPEVAGKDVLVIDDIFDTGHTLVEVLARLRSAGPRSIRSAVLVLKQGKQQVALRPDYVGFQIPDVFVVGYGLDYNGAFRNLPYLAALEPPDIDDQSSTGGT